MSFLSFEAIAIKADNLFLIILDVVVIVKIYRNLQVVYSRVRIKVLSSHWKN